MKVVLCLMFPALHLDELNRKILQQLKQELQNLLN